jgi:hypothetical protein
VKLITVHDTVKTSVLSWFRDNFSYDIQRYISNDQACDTKMDVFWVVAPCSLVQVYQRFRGPCDRPDDGSSKDL